MRQTRARTWCALGAVLALSACAAHRGGSVRPDIKPDPSAVRLPRAQTLEDLRPGLASALALLASSPGVDAHRAVARAYRAEGVYDKAYEHLTAALGIDPRNPALWEARALVARDMGWVSQALSDAHRAVFFGTRSASAHTSLGTILFGMGLKDDAAAEFTTALALDPDAKYTNQNVCASLTAAGRVADAAAPCARAHAADDGPSR